MVRILIRVNLVPPAPQKRDTEIEVFFFYLKKKTLLIITPCPAHDVNDYNYKRFFRKRRRSCEDEMNAKLLFCVHLLRVKRAEIWASVISQSLVGSFFSTNVPKSLCEMRLAPG